jgi:hypothetical protein
MQHLFTLADGGFFDFAWWQWLMILVLVGLIAMLFIMRKKG